MLVITLTKKLGTTCSLLKRSKNLKSQQTQLGPDQNFFSDDDHVGVQGNEKQCNSVEQGCSFEG